MKAFCLAFICIFVQCAQSKYFYFDYQNFNQDFSQSDESEPNELSSYQSAAKNSEQTLDHYIRYLSTNKVKKGYYTKATFYSREECMGHMTAGGVRGVTLREAIRGDGLLQVATDPRYIPMYTRMKIVWNGVRIPAIAVDVGGGVNGNMVDIFVDTNREAINYGVRSVYVEILSDK